MIITILISPSLDKRNILLTSIVIKHIQVQ